MQLRLCCGPDLQVGKKLFTKSRSSRSLWYWVVAKRLPDEREQEIFWVTSS